MAPRPDTTTGTITLTSGAVEFTTVGTNLLVREHRPGDSILRNGLFLVIETITGENAGTLRDVCPADAAGAAVPVRIRFQPDGSRVAAQTRNLIDELGNGNITSFASLTGPGVPVFNGEHNLTIKPETDFINGVEYDVQVATLADRAAYDAQVAGFGVLVSDVGDGRSALYTKKSNTSGDWSAPAYITGPVGPVSTVPGVVWRGTYDAGTTYAINDGVTFNGSSFRKLTTAVAGTPPSGATPPINTTNWEVLASRGSNGDITGVTPFWAARLFADTTAAAAREGLGANLFSGFTNKLINSLGTINQRGYGSGAATSAANQYTIDRWRVVVSGQSLSWTEAAGVRTMTAPAGGVEQPLEGLGLIGGSYVLNWVGTAAATVGGVARAKGEAFTLTGGANVVVRFVGGTFSLPQLEEGASPTKFSTRPHPVELVMCQRFGEPIRGAVGQFYTTSACRLVMPFLVEKRSSPTISTPIAIVDAIGSGQVIFNAGNNAGSTVKAASFDLTLGSPTVPPLTMAYFIGSPAFADAEMY